MKFVVALFLLSIASVMTEQTPVVLCGRQLANARALLCLGKREYEYVNKRGSVHNNMIEGLTEDKEDMDWPWGGRREALNANRSRYKRGGLVDECCLKPCTADVITNYC